MVALKRDFLIYMPFKKGHTINLQHGMSGTSFYNIWCDVKTRCNNFNTPYYIYYGGRGIKVCKPWHKFENFYQDMYEGYLKHSKEFGKKQTQIDRINNNDDYKPSNCKWTTRYEQNRNKRTNINLTYKGKTMCISDWAKELNIPKETIITRYNKHKWSTDKILSTPIITKFRNKRAINYTKP